MLYLREILGTWSLIHFLMTLRAPSITRVIEIPMFNILVTSWYTNNFGFFVYDTSLWWNRHFDENTYDFLPVIAHDIESISNNLLVIMDWHITTYFLHDFACHISIPSRVWCVLWFLQLQMRNNHGIFSIPDNDSNTLWSKVKNLEHCITRSI